jgi:hypothetical protein
MVKKTKNMANFENSQFDYLFSAIADRYPAIQAADGSTQFQFSASPEGANWQSGSDIDAYNMGNAVPLSMNGFYAKSPASLFNAYSDLILSIEPAVDADKDPTYVKLQGQYGDALKNYNSALVKAQTAWLSYKQQNTDPKTGLPVETQAAWLADELGGLEYQVAIDDAKKKKEDLGDKIALLNKSYNAALSNAQKDLTDPNNLSKYKQADGKFLDLPTITLNGDLGTDKSTWDSYPDEQYDLDVTLSKDSIVKTRWKTVYDVEVEQHCFETSVKTTISTSRIISDEHYSLRVKIKGFKAYDVTFGGWYHDVFVHPETAIFSKASSVNTETFFAIDGGSLHMIPAKIWVMYRPEFTLTVSTELYKQTIQGYLDTNIDWTDMLSFRFDTTAGSSLAEVGEKITTISFTSPVLSTPQIFGVTSSPRNV